MAQARVLTEITIYPIKSLRGISLKEWWIEPRGLKYDRRWMLIDEEGKFITQREFPYLALLDTYLDDANITVTAPSGIYITIPLKSSPGRIYQVKIWDDLCEGIEVSEEANQFFSSYLKFPAKLVFMPEKSKREIDKRYAVENEIVSFADAYPLLLISEASLQDLNNKLTVPIEMRRFRPNLVVSSNTPFEENTWKEFSIGGANFQAVKPCSRCVLTTVDPKTGIKGKEPLKTLATYRLIDNKIIFGENLVCRGGIDKIKIGDSVFIKNLKLELTNR